MARILISSAISQYTGKKEKQIPDNSISYFSVIKDKCEPGDSASFIVGTKDSNVYLSL